MALIIIISISMSLIAISLLGIYKYQRTWLGLPPDPKDTLLKVKEDTVYIEPTVQLTEKRFSQINKTLSEIEFYQKQKDSFYKISQFLKDSVGRYKFVLKTYQDSINKTKNNLDQSNLHGQHLVDSINRLNSLFLKAKEKNEISEKKITDQENFINQKEDTLQKKAFVNFAKIYNNSRPADVARILERIDEREAASILKLMSKKKAGKIIEAMKPEQAAAILLLGYEK